MRKILFIGLVVTAVVLVSGCYGPPTSPNATVQPTGGTPSESTVIGTATVSATVATVNAVDITSSGFNPAIISVPSGTQVTWTNRDSVSHTVKSTTGVFDSGPLSSGQSFSETFSTSGSYDYGDPSNSSMSGTVVVT